MNLYDRWKKRRREEERRRSLVDVESIKRRQDAGEITPEQSAAEFDDLLMRQTGGLVFYSDSTGITSHRDADVMILPSSASTASIRLPSNTGIYCRGPRRGYLVTFHDRFSADLDLPAKLVLAHFSTRAKGWINGPADHPLTCADPVSGKPLGDGRP